MLLTESSKTICKFDVNIKLWAERGIYHALNLGPF